MAHLFTIENVAERLSLSASTIRRLVVKGEIKTFKIGRAVRISGDEIDRYVARVTAPEASDEQP